MSIPEYIRLSVCELCHHTLKIHAPHENGYPYCLWNDQQGDKCKCLVRIEDIDITP